MSNKRQRKELSLKEKIQKILKETDLINKLEKECDCYFNSIMEEDIIETIIENDEGSKNFCIECGCDIGKNNPRQLCGKTFCYGF
tara:strand:- start:36 stop:290 length:255 start_codon:yes stop_codon:yes gene_type:complete